MKNFCFQPVIIWNRFTFGFKKIEIAVLKSQFLHPSLSLTFAGLTHIAFIFLLVWAVWTLYDSCGYSWQANLKNFLIFHFSYGMLFGPHSPFYSSPFPHALWSWNLSILSVILHRFYLSFFFFLTQHDLLFFLSSF